MYKPTSINPLHIVLKFGSKFAIHFGQKPNNCNEQLNALRNEKRSRPSLPSTPKSFLYFVVTAKPGEYYGQVNTSVSQSKTYKPNSHQCN